MSERVEMVWYGDDAPAYDHGPRHPLRFARVPLTRSLIHAYGIVDGARVIETPARDASEEEVLLVHSERYVDAVRRAGHGEDGPWCDFAGRVRYAARWRAARESEPLRSHSSSIRLC